MKRIRVGVERGRVRGWPRKRKDFLWNASAVSIFLGTCGQAETLRSFGAVPAHLSSLSCSGQRVKDLGFYYPASPLKTT